MCGTFASLNFGLTFHQASVACVEPLCAYSTCEWGVCANLNEELDLQKVTVMTRYTHCYSLKSLSANKCGHSIGYRCTQSLASCMFFERLGMTNGRRVE